jgi:hypothetical protein
MSTHFRFGPKADVQPSLTHKQRRHAKGAQRRCRLPLGADAFVLFLVLASLRAGHL